jgi:hypothetical protein
MRALRENGLAKVASGETSLAEVARATGLGAGARSARLAGARRMTVMPRMRPLGRGTDHVAYLADGDSWCGASRAATRPASCARRMCSRRG